MTKNITLAIDEQVLKRVRRIAAERDTTVNGLVRDYLTKLADVDDKAKKARLELVELAKRSNWDPGPGFKWNREELYDREALRRYERSDLRGVDEVKGKRKET